MQQASIRPQFDAKRRVSTEADRRLARPTRPTRRESSSRSVARRPPLDAAIVPVPRRRPRRRRAVRQVVHVGRSRGLKHASRAGNQTEIFYPSLVYSFF